MQKKVWSIERMFFENDVLLKFKERYRENLVSKLIEDITIFKFKQREALENTSYWQWSTFENETNYLDPSNDLFILNYHLVKPEVDPDEQIEKVVRIVSGSEEIDYDNFAPTLTLYRKNIKFPEPLNEVFIESYESNLTKYF